MKHAHVKIDGMEIPLIGIDAHETEEICSVCAASKHLQEIMLGEDGKFICGMCLGAQMADRVLKRAGVREFSPTQ